MTPRLGALLVGTAVILTLSGCAGLGSMRAADSTAIGEPRASMTQNRLEQIFSDQVEAITGPTGALQSQIDGHSIYCISDVTNDRMRIVAPISRIQGLDPRIYRILLRANFHSALDARYAISDGVIFSTYLHPLSSLTPVEIESAVAQVISLVKTFGTSFSSGDLEFPETAPDDSISEGEGASPPL